jgi:hypothetical protein
MPRYDLPSAIAARTSRSRGLSRCSASWIRPVRGIRAITSGSSVLLAARRARSADERPDVSPALLEPEADALGIVANQIEGEVVLVGLQEDARSSRHLREPSARTAVAAARLAYMQVRGDGVRAVVQRLPPERLAVACPSDHLEACPREQARTPAARQDSILADHHAHQQRPRPDGIRCEPALPATPEIVEPFRRRGESRRTSDDPRRDGDRYM